jgi:hypothetical protein
VLEGYVSDQIAKMNLSLIVLRLPLLQVLIDLVKTLSIDLDGPDFKVVYLRCLNSFLVLIEYQLLLSNLLLDLGIVAQPLLSLVSDQNIEGDSTHIDHHDHGTDDIRILHDHSISLVMILDED